MHRERLGVIVKTGSEKYGKLGENLESVTGKDKLKKSTSRAFATRAKKPCYP